MQIRRLAKSTISPEQRCELRISLLAEELKEQQKAIKDKDQKEIANALYDLKYVLPGLWTREEVQESF